MTVAPTPQGGEPLALPPGQDCRMSDDGRLPPAHLRLAVMDCLHACRRAPAITSRRVAEIQDKLWREDAGDVLQTYDRLMLGSADTERCQGGVHGLRAERMRELRRPLLRRDRIGKTVAEIAAEAGMPRETMACMLEHHGYLEMVPYGGRQRRRLVSDQAYQAGIGHNVDASLKRIGWLEGAAKAAVFPVFYPEHVPTILWTLDIDGIRQRASSIPDRRARLNWLLSEHAYLPAHEVAILSSYTQRAVELAKQSNAARGAPNVALYNSPSKFAEARTAPL